MPVGWNWKNSMSCIGMPRRYSRPGAVAGERVGVGGDLEHLAEAAGGEEARPWLEDVQVAGGQLVGDDRRDAGRRTKATSSTWNSLKKLTPRGHALLEERLQDHVAGAVGRVAGPAHRRLAVVAGVAAEAALVDLALGRAVERQAEVLELDDRVDRLAAHDLGRGLVDEVVAALHRVEGVPLPGVLFDVGERRAHAALRRAGVRAGGVELGEHRGPALARRLDGGPQAGASRADDHGVVAVVVDVHVGIILSRTRSISCRSRSRRGFDRRVAAVELEVEHERPRGVGRDRLHGADADAAVGGDVALPAHACSPPAHRSVGPHVHRVERDAQVADDVDVERERVARRVRGRRAVGHDDHRRARLLQAPVAGLRHPLVVEHRPRHRRVAVGEAELAEPARWAGT